MANVTTLNREESEKMGNKKINDFSEPIQKAEKKVADTFEAGQKAVSNWMSEEGEKLKGVYNDAEKGVSEAMDSVYSTVKKYPWASIAVGFGLGCLAGFLIRTSAKRD